MVTVLSSNRRQPGGGKRGEKQGNPGEQGCSLKTPPRWSWSWRTLTNVAALAVLVAGQPSVGGVVAPNHPPVVVDDCIQVINGGLLQLLLQADAELAQVQVPAGTSARQEERREERL